MIIGIDASRISKATKTGTENYSSYLIKSLSSVDKKNRYVLYFNEIPQFFEISQTNFSTRYIRSTRLWTQARLAWECLIYPPDVLFVPAHTIPVIRRPNLKTIVTIHDLGAQFLEAYHQFPAKLYLNWSTEYVAKHATHLIAVSNSTKKDLTKTLKVPSDRISVVYEGVDKDTFKPKRSFEIDEVKIRYGLPEKYFLYVGTIQPRKNLVRVIEAFAKANLKNTKLVLAGEKGWLSDDIYKLPEKLSIKSRVKFLGFVPTEDLPALYGGALAFIFPSLYEGFGLPILEAFACRCPVLTSDLGAMAEVADEAAFLVNPKKVDEIADGLKKLASQPDFRNRLAASGIQRAEYFSWDKTAVETLKVFEQVVGENISVSI
jgi:glycosyltransferase involved in cell wall biosynthesis